MLSIEENFLCCGKFFWIKIWKYDKQLVRIRAIEASIKYKIEAHWRGMIEKQYSHESKSYSNNEIIEWIKL